MVSHPSHHTKLISIENNTSFSEFKELMSRAFMDYQDYWAHSKTKSIDWQKTDQNYSIAIMNHIRLHNSIDLMQRIKGGFEVLARMLEKIEGYHFSEVFWRDGRCDLCFDEPSAVWGFSCGCHYCRDCFVRALKLYAIEGDNLCRNHRKKEEKRDIISESLNLVINYCPEEIVEPYVKYVNNVRLVKHINIAYCKCDEIYYNDAGYSKHFCAKCDEYVCFYCQTSWDETKKNQIGMCGVNCRIYSLLNFELEEWEMGASAKDKLPGIPSNRFCPKCGKHGAFGKACKYNTCPSPCDFEFCFFCLNSKTECQRIYGKRYNQKCTEPVLQDIATIFRRNRL